MTWKTNTIKLGAANELFSPHFEFTTIEIAGKTVGYKAVSQDNLVTIENASLTALCKEIVGRLVSSPLD